METRHHEGPARARLPASMVKRATDERQAALVDFYYHIGEGRGTRTPHRHDGHQISITVGGSADIVWWTAAKGEARQYGRVSSVQEPFPASNRA